MAVSDFAHSAIGAMTQPCGSDLGHAEGRFNVMSQVDAFAALDDETRLQLAREAVLRRFDAGERVLALGDQIACFYIVGSGYVRSRRTHAGGRSVTLMTFGPRETFGELAMFDDPQVDAFVEAITDAELIAIPGPRVRAVLMRHPEFGARLVHLCVDRIRDFNNRIEERSFQTAEGRISAALLRLIRNARQDPAGGGDIRLDITQAEIGYLADVTRSSASRFLAALERDRAITQGRGHLTVHEPGALERFIV